MWQDIDNNLCTSDEKEDGIKGVENKKNNVKVKFSQKSNSNYLYRVKDGEYSIFVGAYKKGDVAPNKVEAVIEDNSEEADKKKDKLKIDEASILKNTSSKVTYL